MRAILNTHNNFVHGKSDVAYTNLIYTNFRWLRIPRKIVVKAKFEHESLKMQ